MNSRGLMLYGALSWDFYRISVMFQMLSLDNAECSFYRSFNGIFGRVGRIASNGVIVQLEKSKCFLVLFYELQACPLRKSLSVSLTTHLRKFSIRDHKRLLMYA